MSALVKSRSSAGVEGLAEYDASHWEDVEPLAQNDGPDPVVPHSVFCRVY